MALWLLLLGIICTCLVGGAAAYPIADFSANVTEGDAPLTVQFSDESTGEPATGLAWYFGDEPFDGAWIRVDDTPGWSGRWGQTSVVLPDSSIVLMGGWDAGGRKNDTWRSYDNGSTWTQVNPAAGWSGRAWHTSVILPDGSIVLMGGETDGDIPLNDTWRSEDGGATWTQVNPGAGWSARYSHTSVVLPDGSIVLMGGTDDDVYTNDVWRSPDGGATWTQVSASAGWSERYTHTSVVLPDGSIVVMGGADSADNLMNDVWRSPDGGATWNQVNANAGWNGRFGHTSVLLPDGSIVQMGGSGFPFSLRNDIWRSSDGGATWTQVNESARWSERLGHTSVVLPDGSIVLMGGLDGSFQNDVWRLETAGSYEQNPGHIYNNPGVYNVTLQAYNAGGLNATIKQGYITVTTPPPVANFTATPTRGPGPLQVTFTDESTGSPDEWLWDFGDGYTNTTANPVHTYENPGTYAVTLTAMNAGGSTTIERVGYITVTIPPPAADFTAAPGTGAAPLTVQFSDTSSGDPATGWAWYFGDEAFDGAWTRVSESVGWSGRLWHTSVVLPDGSILLMGGMDNEGYKNDTWRSYDNGATWTLVNESTGWSARGLHTSVVLPDGSVVLMGGMDAGGVMNDTWRSSDNGSTWVQVNASAGWSPRSLPTSVLLPDGGIVLMGGAGSGGPMNDTWRSSDGGATWTQLNPAAGWIERMDHRSVLLPDGSIVLIGGMDSADNRMNDTWRSPDGGATWTLVNESGGWIGSIGHTNVVLPDGSILLMEVNGGAMNNAVWRSPDAGATWTEVNTSAGWPIRVWHTSVVLPDGSIVLMGGFDDGDSLLNDTWRLETAGSYLENPLHTYNNPGLYNVTLQAYNAGGYTAAMKEGYITVTTPTPAPTPTPRPSGGGGSSVQTVSNVGSTSFLQSSAGQVLQNYNLGTADGSAQLKIPLGTTVLNADGGSAGTISIIDTSPGRQSGEIPDVSVDATFIIAGTGYAVSGSPAGTTFSPAILLTFTFTDEEWSELMADADDNPSNLVIKWYNPRTESYEDIETSVDPDSQTVSAWISHFSIYAVFVDSEASATVVPTTPQTTDTPGPVTTAPPQPVVPDEGPRFPGIYMIIGIVVILLLIGVAYYSIKKKEER